MGNIIHICRDCEEPPTSKIDVIQTSPKQTIPNNIFVGTIEEYIYYSNSPKIR